MPTGRVSKRRTRILARIGGGEKEEVKPSKPAKGWNAVKQHLKGWNAAQLTALLKDRYDSSTENRTFLDACVQATRFRFAPASA